MQVKDVTVEDVKTMRPRVLIYDVPNEMSESDVLKELFKKNSYEKGIDEGIFKRETKIVFRAGRKDASEGNVVVESAKGILDGWLQQERVYVGLRCLKVRKYEKVLRCYNCCGYGYMKRECVKEKVCRKCCESGHEEKSCQRGVTCGLCKMNKLEKCDHSIMSEECPIYRINLDRLRKRMNGND